ncbi:hypothetical protein CCACVL1_28756 [Corchorus capsularis]|uniref:Uncharacterized protein n=1 Tax=Corchorus capsularis TaxID=210143 RepID=A0A1R3G5A7_COCAP|nr:hypothetical protein CCACVL1_28756 [Corchorus capsularis]
MVAPPPAFTIHPPGYNDMTDKITPFRDYDNMGPPPPTSFSTNETYEVWTTNQIITSDQLIEYGAYYVGERSDFYAVSHFVYYVEGAYMPVFRRISAYQMFVDYWWMRIMRFRDASESRTPPPASQGQLPKTDFDIFSYVECVQLPPNPNYVPALAADGNQEVGGEEPYELPCPCHHCYQLIEDYFSNMALFQ